MDETSIEDEDIFANEMVTALSSALSVAEVVRKHDEGRGVEDG